MGKESDIGNLLLLFNVHASSFVLSCAIVKRMELSNHDLLIDPLVREPILAYYRSIFVN